MKLHLNAFLFASLSLFGLQATAQSDISKRDPDKTCLNKGGPNTVTCNECVNGEVVPVAYPAGTICIRIGASYIDPISKGYFDDIDDSAKVVNGGGCGPCGGGSAPDSLTTLNLQRHFSSRRAFQVYDFGFGQSSNFDERINFSVTSSGGIKAFLDGAHRSFPLMLDDGGNGDPRDGVFHEQLAGTRNPEPFRIH